MTTILFTTIEILNAEMLPTVCGLVYEPAVCGLVYRAYSVWTSVQSLQCVD